MSGADVAAAITRAHREEWARVVASLTRRFGDLDIAEEAAAEAFAAAVARWPADGVPPSPGAWLTTTASRKAIDRIRRENKRDDKHKEARDRHAGAFRGGYGDPLVVSALSMAPRGPGGSSYKS